MPRTIKKETSYEPLDISAPEPEPVPEVSKTKEVKIDDLEFIKELILQVRASVNTSISRGNAQHSWDGFKKLLNEYEKRLL